MDKPSHRITQCPVCSKSLRISKLECPKCEISLEGKFGGSRLSLLSPAQQQFVEVFLLCGGNFKLAQSKLGISYPTVKKRLDDVIRTLAT